MLDGERHLVADAEEAKEVRTEPERAKLLRLVEWMTYGSGAVPLRIECDAEVPPRLIATAPVLLLAPLALVRLRRNRDVQALSGFAVLVICSYLVYAVFDHWSTFFLIHFWTSANSGEA